MTINNTTPGSVLGLLRALMPPRALEVHEAEGVAERQALKLLSLLDQHSPAVDVAAIAELPRIEVRVDVVDGRARVRVHDNGAGIAPDDLVRVFDPFFTTKPLGQGTGLGLSISYGIVNEHGGRLTAANHVQGGALFTLLLPLEGAA